MNEALRHEIVQRHQAGASMRAIAEELGISRGAVDRALARVQAQRDGRAAPSPRPRRAPQHHRSVRADLEGTAGQVSEPDRRACLARAASTRLHRRLHGACASACGCCGRGPRRRPCRALRPGQAMQAQMDYGVYDIDFTREGRRRVYLFSYLLGYSRRQYLRFVESMDLPTTLREHVHAFHHLGGVARVCLYDNFKAVVLAARRRRPAVQPEVPGLRHALRLPAPGLPRSPAANQGQSRAEVLLCRNQPAQRPHLRHAGASQRSDGLVAGRASPTCASCVTSRNRRASVTSANSRTCCRCRPATSTRPWSSIATSTSKASSPIG